MKRRNAPFTRCQQPPFSRLTPAAKSGPAFSIAPKLPAEPGAERGADMPGPGEYDGPTPSRGPAFTMGLRYADPQRAADGEGLPGPGEARSVRALAHRCSDPCSLHLLD